MSHGSVQASAPLEPSSMVTVGTHWFRQAYLYAFAVRAEVAAYIRTQAMEEEYARLSEIMAAWEALQPRVANLTGSEAGIAESIQLTPVPDGYRSLINDLTDEPLFQRSFSQVPWKVALVEVDKLVAGQRMVNLEYVDRLAKQYGPAPTSEELLRICLSPHRQMEPIQHLELATNTHVFSSPNSDIRFLGSFVKPDLSSTDLELAKLGGMPAAAIIAFVGYGSAPVNALMVGRRVVLNNGFHRAYALRRLGLKEIPVVLQCVHNAQLEFPPSVGQLPREYLLSAPRPVLMKDFFEPDFTVTLKIRERLKMVNMVIGLNQHDVPS